MAFGNLSGRSSEGEDDSFSSAKKFQKSVRIRAFDNHTLESEGDVFSEQFFLNIHHEK
jgi:hypothetical protein